MLTLLKSFKALRSAADISNVRQKAKFHFQPTHSTAIPSDNDTFFPRSTSLEYLDCGLMPLQISLSLHIPNYSRPVTGATLQNKNSSVQQGELMPRDDWLQSLQSTAAKTRVVSPCRSVRFCIFIQLQHLSLK